MEGLRTAPNRLPKQPRAGRILRGFAPRDVRRIIVGAYEMRYELVGGVVIILRIWHTREDRP